MNSGGSAIELPQGSNGHPEIHVRFFIYFICCGDYKVIKVNEHVRNAVKKMYLSCILLLLVYK